MTVTPLPTPVPTTADPTNFDARADLFLAALPPMVTQFNVDIAAVNITAGQVVANAASTAAASQVAVAATTFVATSSSSFAHATGSTGSITFAETGRTFALNDDVSLIRRGDSTVRARGTLSAVDNSLRTMTINRSAIYGAAGTYSDWVVMLAALEGLSGDQVNNRAISFAVAL